MGGKLMVKKLQLHQFWHLDQELLDQVGGNSEGNDLEDVLHSDAHDVRVPRDDVVQIQIVNWTKIEHYIHLYD